MCLEEHIFSGWNWKYGTNSTLQDGNRRWAKKNRLGSVIEGHKQGFSRLEEVIESCLELGVRSITVYAFSIDNFNRTSEEVNGLMNLALQGFDLLPKNKKLGKKLRIRIFGDLSLLDRELQEAIKRTDESTKKSKGIELNICFSYTSRDEIMRTVQQIGRDFRKNKIGLDNITPELFRKKMIEMPDATIRTSGEWRLSDFLLWQNAMGPSHLFFINDFWPDFSNITLLHTIFYYQHFYPPIKRLRRRMGYFSERFSHEDKLKSE